MKVSHVDLWERFLLNRDPAAREALIQHHVGLVYRTARQMAQRLSSEVELSELISAGMIGLIKALDDFDADRGVTFSTYAVPRIRGAMVDDLREKDLAPRSVRKREREVNEARTALEQSLGRPPTDAEIASHMGLDLASYWRWQEAMAAISHVSMDQPTSAGEEEDGARLSDVLSDSDAEGADSRLEREEMLESLKEAIAKLKPHHRTVLALYYYEGLKLKDIAQVLDLTESRISQLRSEAVRSLRQLMRD